MESEEIKALPTSGEASDAGLLRVQSHPELSEHPRRQFPGLFCPLSGQRQDNEVVAVPHQHSQPVAFDPPRLVEDMQRDVRQR
ncbi:hypothetical protein [Streptomyces sp. NBC_00057]|uniref:hypothetical protein n=1 Tax=Streptomyces sp. NBC_00057 TaxID=2975634 RepID=UPI0032445FA9